MNKKNSVLPLILALLLGGCGLFTSHYNEVRHENFTHLKALHMKFWDDWSAGSEKAWDAQQVQSYCDAGDLRFREAYEYAKSKDDNDNTGSGAVKILWREFSENCQLSLSREKLFSTVFKDEIVVEIERNYDYAIAGELSRVGAPE